MTKREKEHFIVLGSFTLAVVFMALIITLLFSGCSPSVNVVSDNSYGPVEYVKGSDDRIYMFYKEHDGELSPLGFVGKRWISFTTCPNHSDDYHVFFEDLSPEVTNVILIVMETKDPTPSYGTVYVVFAYTYKTKGMTWTYRLDGWKQRYVRVAGEFEGEL